MSYAGTNDLISVFNGTHTYSVGTAATCIFNLTNMAQAIADADALIDLKLTARYGTYSFGTSAYGTKSVPVLITKVSKLLAASQCVKFANVSVSPNQSTWADALQKEAMDLLDLLAEGKDVLAGFEPTDQTGAPRMSEMYGRVFNEIVELTGTNLTALGQEKLLAKSVVVKGTALDGTRVYVSDVDYTVYYWDESHPHAPAGYIRRKGTNIASGESVAIDYSYWVDPVFGRKELTTHNHGDDSNV